MRELSVGPGLASEYGIGATRIGGAGQDLNATEVKEIVSWSECLDDLFCCGPTPDGSQSHTSQPKSL